MAFPADSHCLTSTAVESAPEERERHQISAEYKWNLSDVFPSVDAWREAKDRLAGEIGSLARYRGQLSSSPATLADALDRLNVLDKELTRAYVYVSMLADEDTRDAANEGLRQEMVQLAANFGAAASYIEPEILRFEGSTVADFLSAEPRLAIYRFYLEDLARRAPHTLTSNEERILAAAGPLAGSLSSIFNILSNADFPYPVVTLSDGKEARINQATYSVLRASPNRADRERVMRAFLESLGAFSRTFGTTMNGSVQKALFYAKAREYNSSIEMSLHRYNIPLSVYTRLVDGVNANLPTFHRYLSLRKRMMGLDELHYYDLYAPLVSSVTLRFTPEEAEGHILEALAPLGAEYTEVLRRAFSEQWIDMYPSTGKRSGAYSNGGAYDVHPYILMNFNGRYDDMSTLAHELGHTMHSYFSNRTQPYATADYSIFVAEVASTFNESLLIDYMLRTITDDDVRLSILGSYLEGIKSTVVRQTKFAEFEMRMHELAQEGQPITGDTLSKLYLDIVKRYYGHDEGVLVVDDYVAHEWSFIPHFYRDFYVYQYATSFTASEALAQPVKAGDVEATSRFLAFLGTGGSKYPIDLLKDAGVDMTTDAPLVLTMKEMNRVMDEMERILDAGGMSES
ncbi:MAG: oligoendopeptidase F [Vicinamibacterales bacterium]